MLVTKINKNNIHLVMNKKSRKRDKEFLMHYGGMFCVPKRYRECFHIAMNVADLHLKAWEE